MASTPSSTRKVLPLRREGQRSRLEAQILAEAYELLTPFLRCAVPASPPRSRPPPRPRQASQRRLRQAGG
jgi:hypothetical protein